MSRLHSLTYFPLMKTPRGFLICIVAIFSSPLVALSQEGKPHPIDRFYDECIDRNGSTAGMVECTEKAYRKWDTELNRVYGELLKKLPQEKAADLKKAQRDWLTYRDSEFKAIGAVYSGLQGTMYIPAQAYSRLRIVRERTLVLTHYLELVNEAE